MSTGAKSLWELLWDYDPNGLIVVDPDMNIREVNNAFCRMFNVEKSVITGNPAVDILEDVSEFRETWENGTVATGDGTHYEEQDLYVRKVFFSIQDERIIACIMVDLTHEQREIIKMRKRTIEKVHEVVDNQMKVAQEIAGLLGEATAETKASLLKLIQMVEQETA